MKVVVIGGSSGIGAATAQSARARGWDVVVASRRTDPSLDVTDERAVGKFFECRRVIDDRLHGRIRRRRISA